MELCQGLSSVISRGRRRWAEVRDLPARDVRLRQRHLRHFVRAQEKGDPKTICYLTKLIPCSIYKSRACGKEPMCNCFLTGVAAQVPWGQLLPEPDAQMRDGVCQAQQAHA